MLVLRHVKAPGRIASWVDAVTMVRGAPVVTASSPPPIARVLYAETAAQMRCRFVEHCADCRAEGLFLLRLARSRIWRVPTEAVVLVVAAEVWRVVAAAAHALDAEGLLVRLAADRQRDEIIARVGEGCSGAAEPAAAATPAERRLRHADQLPDAADGIERRVAHCALCGIPAAPASAATRRGSRCVARREQRRGRGIEPAKSATTAAAPTGRRLCRPSAELFPLRRRMLT